nr:hypothetical protein CFP56_55183 [Quercus suber]
MDGLFSLFVHHGGNFTENGRKYVGGAVDIVDNCDPDRWSKVEIESICKDFGYTSVSRLWYKMPGVDQERANFHLIVDDSDAMFLTDLVRGHQDIHVYVEHPIHEPILVDEGEDAGEGVQPLALEQDFTGYYDNDDESEHDDDDDGDEFYSFYENDDMYANDQTFNNEDEVEVNANVPTEVAASQMGSRRVGKEPEHPPEVFHINDSSDSVGSDGGGSGLEDDVELTRGVRDFVEDSSDSWDGKDDAEVNEPGQMGAGVMNSDYESEELHSLVESSSNDELGCDSDDQSEDDNRTHVGDEREPKKEQGRKFPVFKPVAKAEQLYFEKDMLFTTPKQFKEAITDYAVSGGWGIKFVKNDLQRVRAVCQEGCKFVAYLAKVPRERSYQLRTLTLEHTCCRSYKNPRCTSSYIGKKLMKKVKRQPNMKLKDIQEAVHDKYTVNISVGKAGRARDKAQEYVDGVYTQQYNQLWEYCEELRRASPGSTILMKVHTFQDGDLAAEMDLLECIRLYLMTRFQENRVKILRVESAICAKVLKRLHKEKLAANRQDAEQYVHPCYHVSTYKACYEPIIAPINGQNMWRSSDVAPVQPPIKRRPPGRPKKKRAKEPNEPTRRGGISKQCKTCGKLGHNKRSCKGEIGGNSSLPGTTNRTSASSKANMHSFSSTPSAPPQSSMHGRATPTAPSQGKTSSATQFAPSQTMMHQSSPTVTPHARTRSTFIHSQQHTSTEAAPHQSGSTTHNSSSSNPKPRQKKRRVVTSETLKASKNASRYMESIRHGGSQSSVHGPRK